MTNSSGPERPELTTRPGHRFLRTFANISLLLILTGCGGSSAEHGQAMAKKGIAVSEKLTAFYGELNTANTKAERGVVERLALIHANPNDKRLLSPERLVVVEKPIEENERLSEQLAREEIRKSIAIRLKVAEKLKESLTALDSLSKFDMQKVETVTGALTASLNEVAGTFGLPKIPDLFGWLQTEIVAAQRSKDIKRGAAAIRWAVYDLALIYEVELGEWAPKKLAWMTLWDTPKEFKLTDVTYKPIPLVDFRSRGIFELINGGDLRVNPNGVFMAFFGTNNSAKVTSEMTLEDIATAIDGLYREMSKAKFQAPPMDSQPESTMAYLLGYELVQSLHTRNLTLKSGGKVNWSKTEEEEADSFIIEYLPDTRPDVRNAELGGLAYDRIQKFRELLGSMQEVHKGLLELIVLHDELFGVPDSTKRPVPKVTDAQRIALSNTVAGQRLLKVWEKSSNVSK